MSEPINIEEEVTRAVGVSLSWNSLAVVPSAEFTALEDALVALCERVQGEWSPIEAAPKDGRTLLLGYYNSSGNWRSLRGQWFNDEQIAEWENGEDFEAGWYETSVENDDPPNCWLTHPTHYRPLPPPPKRKEK